jgi:hypothetical protein
MATNPEYALLSTNVYSASKDVRSPANTIEVLGLGWGTIKESVELPATIRA